MHEDDQLAGLEEGFAVFRQKTLRDMVGLSLTSHAPGERVAGDFGIGRVGCLHGRWHGELDRRAFDDSPLLAASESRAAVVI